MNKKLSISLKYLSKLKTDLNCKYFQITILKILISNCIKAINRDYFNCFPKHFSCGFLHNKVV